VIWHASQAYSFAASSVSGGALFNGVGNAIPDELRAYDSQSGAVLLHVSTAGAVNSSAAIVGDAIYFGAGNSFDGKGGAVFAYGLPDAGP
jgi:hypothetical protein